MDRESRSLSKAAAEEMDSESYRALVTNLVDLVERARGGAVRSVNAILTSTYWLIGQRIVEHSQRGARTMAMSRCLKSDLPHFRYCWRIRTY
jgi:hypothetical protein